jgi:hypothetical protein
MLTLLVLAVVGWLAFGRQPATTATPEQADVVVAVPDEAPASPAPAGESATAPSPATGSVVGSLPVTGEADAYAAAVATVVFGMDTQTLEPGAYRQALLDAADPHLSSTGYADLERLLAERVPTGEQWARMRANAQRSTFEPEQVWEPGSWARVVIAGDAQPGWVVRNVTGVQTTSYTEDGVVKSAARERTVTVAMRCPAPGAGVQACRLVLVGGSVLP